MREEILALLGQEDYTGMTTSEIVVELTDNSVDSFKKVMKALNQLESDKIIYRNLKQQYILSSQTQIITGKLSMNAKGFGFVVIDEDSEDVYIGKDNLNGALNKDMVEVLVLPESEGHSCEGRVLRILERGMTKVVGLIVERKGRLCVLSDDAKFKEIIFLEGDLKGAVQGHKVVVELTKFTYPYMGRIVQILGHKNDPGVDIMSVVAKYDLAVEFPEKVMEEVEAIPDHVLEEEYQGRVDLRGEMIITIDGDDSKDFDDAISLRKIGKHYLLGVHIADVSHYVKEGSPLDKEAIARGTSVYLVDRVIPMLPHKLSNGICSLNPDVDRLTISCMMEIDEYGEVLNHNIVPSVIHSKHRMTYKNVNKILKHDKDIMREYSDIVDLCFTMKELSLILRRKRDANGAIDFDAPEAQVIVNGKGKAVDVVLRERGTSERIIEEFMLLANMTIAEHFFHMSLPFIYRVHEHPKKKKLQQFVTIASRFGYKIKGSLDNVYPAQLSAILEASLDKPEHTIISTLMLRSMQKARYDENCLGHYGLAEEYYTHFTSPIRRYPDLLVSRMIHEYLFNNHCDAKTVKHFEEVLPDLAKSSSDCEIDAVNCERDVDDMKMAEYMSLHVGEVFEGMISSVTSFGFFVELPNTIEGLVHISTISDDYYHFDENMLMLVGERTGRLYKMSDSVKVRLTAVNKLDGQIDFELLTNRPSIRKSSNGPVKALKNDSKKGRINRETRSFKGRRSSKRK